MRAAELLVRCLENEDVLDAFVFEYFPNGVRHILVFASDQAIATFDDGHPAAKSPVHLPEFQPDIAAADDDQMHRQKIDFHHA